MAAGSERKMAPESRCPRPGSGEIVKGKANNPAKQQAGGASSSYGCGCGWSSQRGSEMVGLGQLPVKIDAEVGSRPSQLAVVGFL